MLTSIQENPVADLKFEVYPNPFNNQLSLSFYNKDKQTVKLVLSDITSKIVFEQEFTAIADAEIVFTLSPEQSISSGVCFLNVILKNQVNTIKVIKK